MSRFDIISVDPYKFRSEIVNMWQQYLADTPEGRFEWMQEKNPEGPATWLFAYDNNNGAIAGMVSLIPRLLFYAGKSYGVERIP